MATADLRRPVLSMQLLARLGLERGLPLETALRDTGLEARQLWDPAGEVEPQQELQLIRNLLQGLGDPPGLGLDAGLRYHLSTHGIWGFSMLTSPTFRSAAEIAVRYLDLSYAFTRFRLEKQGQDLLVLMDDSALPDDLRQFLLERDFAAWANAAWEIRPGGFRSCGAQFRFARPDYGWRFDKLCGLQVEFQAPRNAVLLAARDLDLPLPQSNPLLARVCEEQCQRLVASRQALPGISGQVRDRLMRDPTAMPSLDTVARELHLAPRTLRRHLEREGTSFRALLDQVRQSLAEELLLTAQMKLSEIAERLGYTEPAAFVSAFKRWKKMSPSAYRSRHQAGA